MSNSKPTGSRQALADTPLEALFVERDVDRRLEHYWSWTAVTLFLLVPVDLITTSVVVSRYGVDVIANPFVTWLFGQGPVTFVAVPLAGAMLATGLVHGVLETLRHAPRPLQERLALLFEVWIGLMVSLGLLLLVNDLAAIFFRVSLL